MKNLLLAIVTAVMLSGCITMPEKPPEAQVVIKYRYIVTDVPADMLVIPPPMYKIDPKTATDKEAAQWLVDSEKRFAEIEKKLQAIKDYLAKKMADLKIPEADLVRN